jgi:hypothetical protein
MQPVGVEAFAGSTLRPRAFHAADSAFGEVRLGETLAAETQFRFRKSFPDSKGIFWEQPS